ncbi:hypothetical protein JCM10212_001641 [Sporobolomyces blumeae]
MLKDNIHALAAGEAFRSTGRILWEGVSKHLNDIVTLESLCAHLYSTSSASWVHKVRASIKDGGDWEGETDPERQARACARWDIVIRLWEYAADPHIVDVPSDVVEQLSKLGHHRVSQHLRKPAEGANMAADAGGISSEQQLREASSQILSTAVVDRSIY